MPPPVAECPVVTAAQGVVPVIDGFQVVERTYCDDDSQLSVGLANIHAVVPGIEENKAKIERAARIFADLGVNLAIFPEFALSGYFWDDEPACRAYLDQALTENHLDWFTEALHPLCTGKLRGIVLNNLTTGPDDQYVNRTMLVSPHVEDPLSPDRSYAKIFLPGIEKTYTVPGIEKPLVLSGSNEARVGFTTCYDYLFTELLRHYSFVEDVDAVIQVAAWRAIASREYPGMNVRTDVYYGDLWDTITAALILLVVILVVQNVIQTIVLTRLTSSSLNLHPILTLGSTLAGGALLGLLGATLAAPAVAVISRSSRLLGEYDGSTEGEARGVRAGAEADDPDADSGRDASQPT